MYWLISYKKEGLCRLLKLYAFVLVVVDGQWGPWSQYSDCSKTCRFGIQIRKRMCDSPPPANGGKGCDGPAVQSKKCNVYKWCPGKAGIQPSCFPAFQCTSKLLFRKTLLLFLFLIQNISNYTQLSPTLRTKNN